MVNIPRFSDIQAAAQRIRPEVLWSPLVYSDVLSTRVGKRVFMKLDSLQPGGSFKLRGATNAVKSLSAEQCRKGVVAASSGNFGTALALAAKSAGIKATIVIPDNAPAVKVERIRRAGAEIIHYGAHYGDSEQEAARLAEGGLVLVHPFDDPLVVAGQGTIAMEIVHDGPPELDAVVAGIGGGGLIAGIAIGMHHLAPECAVYGVEPVAAPSMTEALKAGRPVPISPEPTCADGLSPRVTGCISFEVARKMVRQVALLSENELLEATRYCFRELKVVAEPSGAAGVAALLSGKVAKEEQCVAVVISGSNLDHRFRDVLFA